MGNIDLSTQRGFEVDPVIDGKVSGAWGGIDCDRVCNGCVAVGAMIERNEAGMYDYDPPRDRFPSLDEHTQEMVTDASDAMREHKGGTIYGADCSGPTAKMLGLGKKVCRGEFYPED